MTIIETRANQPIHLAAGKHAEGDTMCLLEAAAWIAGEPWSDRPECVDPVIAAFGRSWNDTLPDDDRDRLLGPYAVRIIGTRSTPDVQDKRAFMAADWAVRTFTPAWLRKAGLDDDAAALEALPELSTTELCRAAMPTIAKAKKSAAAAGAAAWDAAWDAAGAAAGDAAWDAAWAAARDAAGAAAGDAAWDAARAAAGAAAGDAAWDAAWDAAGDALADTVTELQQSALDLLDRMIEVTA